MNTPAPRSFPSAAVKVRLLQDALYTEDADLWATLLKFRTHIDGYFAEIGLELVVHEDDGFAYLRQSALDETADIPRLFRRDKLTKGVAVIGVLLREQLLRFDENVHDETKLIVRRDDLMQWAAPYFPETNDEIRADKRIETAVNRAAELGLLRLLPGETDVCFEVRRIVKARFSADTLRSLKEELHGHADARDDH